MAAPHFAVQFRLRGRPNKDRPAETIARPRIVVGSRPLADVFVPDRLIPQEAFELAFDGRRLDLTVGGALSGVFVNGALVGGTGPVADGAAIQCGTCRIDVAIDEEEAACRLTVSERYLAETVAAAAKKAGKEFALEESGPQEQRWGRSAVLRTWNWVAAFAGIALCASLAPLADTEAMNRGALFRGHAPGSEFGPKDCAGCHAPWSSDYGPLCAKCHEEYDATSHHPYGRAADFSCNECHPEHRGADASLLPPMDAGASGWARTCERCHAGEDRGAKVAAASADPSVAAKARDRQRDPVVRALHVDGFSHADHRVAKAARPSSAGGPRAPDGTVPVPCAKCHERRASKDVPGASDTADFGLVPYEKCLECHATWRVDVHGRDDGGSLCFRCHERTDDQALVAKPVRTAIVPAAGGKWSVVPRRHDFAKDDCRRCHVEEKAAAQRTAPVELAFRHDHHLRTVSPETGRELDLAAACVPCHGEVAASASLAALGASLPVANLSRCTDCHTEGAPVRVARAAPAERRIVDMFHSAHTVEPGAGGAPGTVLGGLSSRDTLARGCLSCHVPGEGAAPMTLRDGVADCTACHAAHEHVGGGRCAFCHLDRNAAANSLSAKDPRDGSPRTRVVYRANEAGIFDRAKAVQKTTSPVRWFDHFSPGHAPLAADPTCAGCSDCHAAGDVDAAVRVLDVRWPGATDAACVRCHVAERFHR